MAELQWRCLLFLKWPFTVVFQHQHLFWRSKIVIAMLAQEPTCSVFTPKREDAIFPRGMVVSWQGGCFRSGRRLCGVLEDHFHREIAVQIVARAAPHRGPTLWAQGHVPFGSTLGFCWLMVYEIICIPQANSWCRESLLVVGTSVPAAPCHVWFQCWHWCLCSMFS